MQTVWTVPFISFWTWTTLFILSTCKKARFYPSLYCWFSLRQHLAISFLSHVRNRFHNIFRRKAPSVDVKQSDKSGKAKTICKHFLWTIPLQFLAPAKWWLNWPAVYLRKPLHSILLDAHASIALQLSNKYSGVNLQWCTFRITSLSIALLSDSWMMKIIFHSKLLR